MVLVIYEQRNKGVVGGQDKERKTWHTKGAFEDRDMVKSKIKEAKVGSKKAP